MHIISQVLHILVCIDGFSEILCGRVLTTPNEAELCLLTNILPLLQISYQVCTQAVLVHPRSWFRYRDWSLTSVLNRAPRPPTLANSGGPNPLKLCSLRRAWSLQTPDFLTRPQLLRLEIRQILVPSGPSPSSPTMLSSRCSTCTSANFMRPLHYKGSIPIPNSGHPLLLPLQFFLRIAYFFLFCSFSPSYSLSSTSPTIWWPVSVPGVAPKLTRHLRGAAISNRSVLYLSPCSGGLR